MKRILIALFAVLSILAFCVSCSEPTPKEKSLTIQGGFKHEKITTITIKDEIYLADLAGKTFTYDDETYTIMSVDTEKTGTAYLVGSPASNPENHIHFYTVVTPGKKDWVDSSKPLSVFDTLIFDIKPQYGGSLIIYSTNSDALVEAAYVFGETYGITVDVRSMGSGEVAARVVAEAGNPKADVWYGGVNFANGNKYASYFEPYVAAGNEKLPEAYQNQNGCVTRYRLTGSAALLINVRVFRQLGLDPDEFKGYNDLLRPELKGHIVMGNPATSSSAFAELTNMLLVMGEKPYDEAAWAWVERLYEQTKGSVLSSSSAIYNRTASGEYAVGVSYEDPCVGLLDNGATNIRIVYPEEGAVWIPDGAAILKGAKNMSNAKLFMDWLISDEGQSEIGKTTTRPVNMAITNTSANMPAFETINVVYEDLAYCADHKKEWQTRFANLL